MEPFRPAVFSQRRGHADRHDKGRALAARMPQDRVLTETDGPFAQLDGRAALPWDAEQAITSLAEVWGQPVAAVRARISDNLRHLAEAT